MPPRETSLYGATSDTEASGRRRKKTALGESISAVSLEAVGPEALPAGPPSGADPPRRGCEEPTGSSAITSNQDNSRGWYLLRSSRCQALSSVRDVEFLI